MPRKANILWIYFTKIDGKEEAKCNRCSQVLGCKKASTSSLRHHMKAMHPIDAAALQRAETAKKRQHEIESESLDEAICDDAELLTEKLNLP